MSTYVIAHSGIKGMRHGVRRFQYEDGSLTPEGRLRYLKGSADGNYNASEYEKTQDELDAEEYERQRRRRQMIGTGVALVAAAATIYGISKLSKVKQEASDAKVKKLAESITGKEAKTTMSALKAANKAEKKELKKLKKFNKNASKNIDKEYSQYVQNKASSSLSNYAKIDTSALKMTQNFAISKGPTSKYVTSPKYGPAGTISKYAHATDKAYKYVTPSSNQPLSSKLSKKLSKKAMSKRKAGQSITTYANILK